MFKIDARRLRRFAIPALAAVLGVLAILSIQWARRESTALLETLTRIERRQQDDAAVATLQRHAQSIDARMQAWARRGLFEPPDRFRWIGAVGRARDAARLPSVDYEFAASASTATPGDGAQAPPGSSLAELHLTVRVRLAHEGQLLTFFDALDAEPGGALRVRTCEIKRLPDASDSAALLDAQCELTVFNAHPLHKT